jgi:acetyl esterase/lipase
MNLQEILPLRGSLPAVLVSLTTALGLSIPSPVAASEAEEAPAEFTVLETLDQHYVDDTQARHLLDIYRPEGVTNAPVVLFVHGGAWMSGDKDFYGLHRKVGRFFAAHGFVAVVINYGLSPAVKHPEHVRDVARAYAWVRGHVAAYGGDRDRIILCGHSAGGHLVALLATDEQYLRDPALKLTDADRAALKAVISVSGVYQVPGPDELIRLGEGLLNSMLAEQNMAPVTLRAPEWLRHSEVLNPFYKVFGADAEVLRQASPQSHVRKGLPPFLVLHAAKDLPLLADQAQTFAKALKEAGNPVQLERMEASDHTSILFRLWRPENATARVLLAFLKGYQEGIVRQ